VLEELPRSRASGLRVKLPYLFTTFRIERGDATAARARHGLPVDVVLHVARSEHRRVGRPGRGVDHDPLVHLDPEAETEFEVLTQPEAGQEKQFDAPTGLMGSNMEVLRHKRFAEMTDEEKAALRKLMQKFKFLPPKRRTRRHVSARDGIRPDLRRTIRSAMRRHGEVVDQHWKERRVRRRKVILILDISGSMADYSRALMHFGYAAARAAVGTTASAKLVEVFCFGTRLTRITQEMQKRDPDVAFDAAAKAVFDWEGGTRIGESLDKFVSEWGRRGMCRGAIVVICSDGLDRGDPAVLAEAMELTPFHKMLYSSDAFGLPELHYLGAAGFRRDLARVTGAFVADGAWSAADAERVGHLAGAANARRVYRLG